jgi:3-oxoacyl-[acyl-carrier-protein] synthase II
VTEPDPSGHSYSRAIVKALADAKVPPAAVDLVVPHGLGIAKHDQAEVAGLLQVFGRGEGGLERVPLAPIKGQIGNLAAGCGVDAAAAVLAVHSGKIPAAKNTN